MSAHACPGEDCGYCDRLIEAAEFEADHGHDADPYGWEADRQADREERQRDRWFG